MSTLGISLTPPQSTSPQYIRKCHEVNRGLQLTAEANDKCHQTIAVRSLSSEPPTKPLGILIFVGMRRIVLQSHLINHICQLFAVVKVS